MMLKYSKFTIEHVSRMLLKNFKKLSVHKNADGMYPVCDFVNKSLIVYTIMEPRVKTLCNFQSVLFYVMPSTILNLVVTFLSYQKCFSIGQIKSS